MSQRDTPIIHRCTCGHPTYSEQERKAHAARCVHSRFIAIDGRYYKPEDLGSTYPEAGLRRLLADVEAAAPKPSPVPARPSLLDAARAREAMLNDVEGQALVQAILNGPRTRPHNHAHSALH